MTHSATGKERTNEHAPNLKTISSIEKVVCERASSFLCFQVFYYPHHVVKVPLLMISL